MGAPGYSVVPEVGYWLEDTRKTTSGLHRRIMGQFAMWLEAEGMRLGDFLSRSKEEPKYGEGILRRFHNSLMERQLAPSTASTYYHVIRSFLKFYGISLPQGRRGRGAVRYEGRRLYTQEEVRLMVEAAKSFRDKAIIAFLAQSGQRAGVLTAMKWGHVRGQIESGERIVTIDVPEFLEGPRGYNVNKASTQYRFAILDDAVRLIRTMIRQRSEWGEKVADDSPLFRSYNKSRGCTDGIRRIRRSQPGESLTASSFEEILKLAAEDAGVQKYELTKLGMRWAQVNTRGFRRYFKHRMREGGVQDEALLDFLIGHKVAYDGAYDVFTPEYIRREVAKAEPYLSLVPRQLTQAQSRLETLRTMAKVLVTDVEIMAMSTNDEAKALEDVLGRLVQAIIQSLSIDQRKEIISRIDSQ